MRIALATPIDPLAEGTGLARRALMWQRALDHVGDVTTIVVPVSGPAPDDGAIVVQPEHLAHATFPPLARRAPEYLGARLSCDVDPFDVVVAFRSYLGPFAVGLARANDCPIIVDLDDDDAEFWRQGGNAELASRYQSLVAWLSSRTAVMTAASVRGVGGVAARHVPNALADIDAEPAPSSHSASSDSLVVMVGNFDYQPNQEGAAWFVDQVVPHLNVRIPEARVVLAGPMSERLQHGVGFVDDLGELYREAAVIVAPNLTGSGSRFKIIEAWQFGRPVVATSAALDGLVFEPGRDAVVADDPIAFASAVGALIDDRARADLIGAAGRRVFEKWHHLDVVGGRIAELVEGVVSGRPVPLSPVSVPGLEVTEVDDGLVVFDPRTEQVHHLNPAAASIFVACDGTAGERTIAELLADAFGLDQPPYQEVRDTVFDLISRRLLAG